MGIAHGAFCVGCCWSLMLVMFGVGLGSLTAMLALGALTAVEKNLPWGRRLTRPLGVVLILAARLRGRRREPTASYARRMVDDDRCRARTTRAERREQATADTRASILEAARATPPRRRLRQPLDPRRRRGGRGPAQPDPLPLRQQAAAHPGGPRRRRTTGSSSASARCSAGREPLWRQWERACDYLDDDLESGYVRVLQEMIAAGWSDAEVAAAVRELHRRLVPAPGRRRRARGGAARRPRAVHARARSRR